MVNAMDWKAGDNVVLATSPLTGRLAARIGKAGSLKDIKWGSGIYGPHRCVSIRGVISKP